MQAAPRLTGVETQKLMWTATFVALTARTRPSTWRDSPCALIGVCIRFHPLPGYQVSAPYPSSTLTGWSFR